ncbi:hypothetical protein [Algibacter luteus]|uniref:Uncharacterized protein n=1 Tax=Algibacter luteus TaxID=1178825 RepID=A0A1M5ZX59_9FLAO|nr:hypothetical protein [Algibacter luteus]SHI28844.1 hypothetical protein SAMN05216261_0002 [Algibacter luteus]
MKTNQLKNFFRGIIVFMLFSFQTYAQDSWTLLKEESNIQIFYELIPCESGQNIDPIEFAEQGDLRHETFKLKIINNNASSKSITFSKVTTTNNSDELETISVVSGTTLLQTCESAPKMMLTKQYQDQYPIAVTDFLNEFIINIEN